MTNFKLLSLLYMIYGVLCAAIINSSADLAIAVLSTKPYYYAAVQLLLVIMYCSGAIGLRSVTRELETRFANEVVA